MSRACALRIIPGRWRGSRSAVSAPTHARLAAAPERLRSKLAARALRPHLGRLRKKLGDDGVELGVTKVRGGIEMTSFSVATDKNKYFIALVKNKTQMTKR